MRGWRDTQLAVVRCSRPGPLLLPGLENALTAPGRFGVFPLPTPTACKFGARPASPIQYGRKRIIEKPILESAESHGWIGLFLRAGNMSCTHPLD
jgi:hypothetical protein